MLIDDFGCLARGIDLLRYFSDPFRTVFSFSSFHSGVRSSKEYSRYRSSYRNINYVRSKQVNNLELVELVYSLQSFRGGAKHRVASERAAQRSSRREQLGHTTELGLQFPQLRVKSLAVLQASDFLSRRTVQRTRDHSSNFVRQ